VVLDAVLKDTIEIKTPLQLCRGCGGDGPGLIGVASTDGLGGLIPLQQSHSHVAAVAFDSIAGTDLRFSRVLPRLARMARAELQISHSTVPGSE